METYLSTYPALNGPCVRCCSQSAKTPIAMAVLVRAEHLCLRMRGAAKRGADMVTTAFRGEFARNRSLRAEVLGLLRPHGAVC